MLNTLYNSMKDLTKADQVLSDKVQSIEVLVAGNYVKKSELEYILHKLDTKLDRIEDKIDHTQDRRARYSVPE